MAHVPGHSDPFADFARGLISAQDLAMLQAAGRGPGLIGGGAPQQPTPPQGALPQQPPQQALPPTPQAPPTGGGGGLLASLFGGPGAGLLGGQQQRAAGIQALIAAGGGLAAAGQPEFGVAPRTFASAISEGLSAGRASFADTVERGLIAQDEIRRRDLRQDLEQADTQGEELRALAPTVIASGDPAQIAGFMELLRQSGGSLPPELERFEGIDPETGELAFFVMDELGNVSRVEGADPVPNASGGTSLERFIALNPETGQNEFASFNKATGQVEFTGVLPPTEEAKDNPLTESELKLGILYNNALPLNSVIDEFNTIEDAPGIVSELVEGVPVIQRFRPEDDRRLSVAARGIAELWLRPITGAAITADEIESARELFVPQARDTQAILDLKKQNRERLFAISQRRLLGKLQRSDFADAGFSSGTGQRVRASDLRDPETGASVVVDPAAFDIENF